MKNRKHRKYLTSASAMWLILLCGCAPEAGSDAWCETMVEKDKGEWTANEATEFARSCIFKTYKDG